MPSKNMLKVGGLVVAFAIIVAGTSLFVHAQTSEAKNGTNHGANGIKGLMRNFMGHMATTGTVTATSGSSITVQGNNGTIYSVNAANAGIFKISGTSKSKIQTSDIKVGDTVSIKGTVSGASITATEIIDGALPVIQKPAASGSVSAISGNTITINSNGTTYTVDASNSDFAINKTKTSLGNAHISVGDTISVFGNASGTNVTAVKISDGTRMGMR